MKITLSVKGAPAVQQTLRAIGRQAPFAVSTALNNIANEVQRGVQDSLGSRFTLRRSDFIKKTIYRGKGVDFATKSKLQATVRVNPQRDVLVQHEEGQLKTPRSGLHVAVPLEAVRPVPSAVVPKRLRPSGLRGHPQVRKITTPAGTFLVRNRPGKGKGGLNGWRTEFLYELKRAVPLRPRLRFHATAQGVIEASWQRHLLQGIEKALRTAR